MKFWENENASSGEILGLIGRYIAPPWVIALTRSVYTALIAAHCMYTVYSVKYIAHGNIQPEPPVRKCIARQTYFHKRSAIPNVTNWQQSDVNCRLHIDGTSLVIHWIGFSCLQKAVRWTSNKHSFPNYWVVHCIHVLRGMYLKVRAISAVRRRSGKGWIEITPVTFDSWEGVSTEIYLSHLMWHARILQGWKFTRNAPTSYSV